MIILSFTDCQFTTLYFNICESNVGGYDRHYDVCNKYLKIVIYEHSLLHKEKPILVGR